MASIIRGSTGIIRQVFIKDSTQTDGRGKTGLPVFTIIEAGDTGNYLASWVLTGFTDTNSDNFVYYWNLVKSGTNYTVSIYSDLAKTQLVAEGTRNGIGSITLDTQNASGLSGSVMLSGSPVTDTDAANTLTMHSSISVYYKRNKAPTAFAIPLIDSSLVTLGTFAGGYSVGAIKEIDSVNMPGLYELHLPNACVDNISIMAHQGVIPEVSILSLPPDSTTFPGDTNSNWYTSSDAPAAVYDDPDAINTKSRYPSPGSSSTYGTSDELVIEIIGTGVQNTVLNYSLVAAGDYSPEGIIVAALPNNATVGGILPNTVGGLPLYTGVVS